MEDYGQIKINQYRTCMIIPFRMIVVFGQMLQEKVQKIIRKENKKRKNERLFQILF